MSVFRKLAFCRKPTKTSSKETRQQQPDGKQDQECAVCQDVPTDPCTVPCGNKHVFCLTCLQGVVQHNSHRNTFPCPLCRTRVKIPIRGLSVLKNDKDFRDKVLAKLPAMRLRRRRRRSRSRSSSASSSWIPPDLFEVVIPWDHVTEGPLDPGLLEALEDVPVGRVYLDVLSSARRASADGSVHSDEEFPLDSVDIALQMRILEEIQRQARELGNASAAAHSSSSSSDLGNASAALSSSSSSDVPGQSRDPGEASTSSDSPDSQHTHQQRSLSLGEANGIVNPVSHSAASLSLGGSPLPGHSRDLPSSSQDDVTDNDVFPPCSSLGDLRPSPHQDSVGDKFVDVSVEEGEVFVATPTDIDLDLDLCQIRGQEAVNENWLVMNACGEDASATQKLGEGFCSTSWKDAERNENGDYQPPVPEGISDDLDMSVVMQLIADMDRQSDDDKCTSRRPQSSSVDQHSEVEIPDPGRLQSSPVEKQSNDDQQTSRRPQSSSVDRQISDEKQTPGRLQSSSLLDRHRGAENYTSRRPQSSSVDPESLPRSISRNDDIDRSRRHFDEQYSLSRRERFCEEGAESESVAVKDSEDEELKSSTPWCIPRPKLIDEHASSIPAPPYPNPPPYKSRVSSGDQSGESYKLRVSSRDQSRAQQEVDQPQTSRTTDHTLEDQPWSSRQKSRSEAFDQSQASRAVQQPGQSQSSRQKERSQASRRRRETRADRRRSESDRDVSREIYADATDRLYAESLRRVSSLFQPQSRSSRPRDDEDEVQPKPSKNVTVINV